MLRPVAAAPATPFPPHRKLATAFSTPTTVYPASAGMRTENLVKILAEPRLLTLSGRPAQFIDGGQIPIVSSSTGGSSKLLPFGTVLNFVPIVLGNGKIHLEVAASLSQPNSSVGVSIPRLGLWPRLPVSPRVARRSPCRLEDGQTLAIGGLIQNSVTGQTTKIPWLGDLPYCGVFFRGVTYTETEEELLILVTPRLVDPMACTQLKPFMPGRETRSADDFELFMEGIMEARAAAARSIRTIVTCLPFAMRRQYDPVSVRRRNQSPL